MCVPWRLKAGVFRQNELFHVIQHANAHGNHRGNLGKMKNLEKWSTLMCSLTWSFCARHGPNLHTYWSSHWYLIIFSCDVSSSILLVSGHCFDYYYFRVFSRFMLVSPVVILGCFSSSVITGVSNIHWWLFTFNDIIVVMGVLWPWSRCSHKPK